MKPIKKYIAVLLALILAFGSSPLNFLAGSGPGIRGIFELRANAYSQENGYEYYLLGDNTVRIFSLTQYFSGNVSIPPTLGGYTVTQIGESVFENKDDVTAVTVPAGVKLIADNAFRSCDGLLSVSLPAGLTTIGNNVFMDDIHLTAVSVPDSVTSFGSSVFFNCTALQTAVVGNGVTALPSQSFGQCYALASVTLPSNLQNIGYGAFMDDYNLTTVVIPSAVTEIQQYAFRGCMKLSDFTFAPPAHITTLGEGAFYNCQALTQITLPASLTVFDVDAFYFCINLTSITIPYGTTAIPYNMFNSCGKLAYVYLPDTVTSIGENAFIWCTSLPSINLPGGLKSIGNSAFYHCAALKSISLPEGLETLDYQAFASSGLQVVSLPSTLTSLPNKAFYECYDLLSVTMPDSLINFGTDVFKSCYDLTIYCNPGSVAEQYAIAKSIPHINIASYTVQFNANGGTPALTTITRNCGTALAAPSVTRTGYTLTGWSPAAPTVMPAANTTYTAQWTVNKYKVEYHIGSTVTTYNLNYGDNMIPPLVFFQPDDLNVFTGWSPEVPVSVPAYDTSYTAQYTPVYTYTLSGGNAIITAVSTQVSGSVNIPGKLDGYTVASIGYHAFQDCTGITGISIPSSVTYIDARAFMGCTGLTAVTVPSGVTSIGNQAFQDCTALASITLPASLASIGGAAFANTAWMNAKPDGAVYAGKVFYKYKGTMPAGTMVTVEDGTLGIAGGAFSGCTGLTGIALPESLTVIGANAFNGCSGFGAAVIPRSVTVIGSQAFQNCTALTLGVYPDAYAHTYANSNSIPHVLVAKITFDANGGTGGTSTAMVIGSALTAPVVTRSSFVFSSWSPALPATVPEGDATYVAQWTTLLAYSIANEKVTITGLNATLNGRLTIPDTIEGFPVKYIAAGALENKTGITGLDFPAGLLTIGEQAFRGCTGLTGSVTLPPTLTTIEAAAFIGCTNLTSMIIPASVRTIGTDAFAGCTGLTLYVYPRSRAMLYAETNRLNYRVFATVSFSLNGGTGTVPATQSGLDGDEVIMPQQGDIARTNYHFLGWSPSPTATEPFANYTMAPSDITLYAVWSLIPGIAAFSGATTVIDTQSGYIYGLAPGITQAEFESAYIALTGNGRLEYSPETGSIGTGTTVKVIDNITGLAVQTFTVLIYGDVNGDGNINGLDAGIMVNVENYMTAWDAITDAALIKAGDINGDGNINGLDAGIAVNVENYLAEINQVTGLV